MATRRSCLLIAGTTALALAPLSEVTAQQGEDALSKVQKAEIRSTSGIITSGSERIKLGISGQVNRGILSYDDGEDTGTIHVDNDNSSTRIRFTAETLDLGQLTVGTVIELQFESNSTADVDQENQRGVGPDHFTERKLEAYATYDGIGTLTIGQGDHASNGSSESDLSGTSVIGYSGVADLAGGLRFRTRTGTLTDINIGSVFSNFDGLSRDDRLRYDSPVIAGFIGAVSVGSDDRWDIALRQSGDYGTVKTAFAVAYADPGDAAVDSRVSGSFSARLGNGLNATFATGRDDRDDRDPSFGYVKLGYLGAFTSLGATAFSVDYYTGDDMSAEGDESTSVGLQIVQALDRYSTELYAGIRNHEFESEGQDVDDVLASLVGLRVKF